MNWETSFDHQENTMTHRLNSVYSVVCDFKYKKITITKNGDPVNSFSLDEINTVEKYTEFLKDTYKSINN